VEVINVMLNGPKKELEMVGIRGLTKMQVKEVKKTITLLKKWKNKRGESRSSPKMQKCFLRS